MRRLIIDIYPSDKDIGRFDILINGESEENITAHGIQEIVKAEISKAIESLD